MTATTLTSNYPSSDHNDVAALAEDEELIRHAKSVANRIEEQKQQPQQQEEARDEEAAPSEVDIFLSRLGLTDFVTGVGSVVSEIASEITSIADDVSVDIEKRTVDAEARIRERSRAVEERERLEADMSDEDSVEQAKKVKGSPKTLMKLCKKLKSQEKDLKKAEKYFDKVEDEVADTREKIRALSIKFGMGNAIYEENDVTLDDFMVKGSRRTLRNLIKKLQKQDKQLKKADEAVIKVQDEIKKTEKKIKVLSQKFGLQGAQEHSSSGTRMSYYSDDEDLESVGEQLGDAFKAAGDEIAYFAPIVARAVGKNIDDAHKAIQREIFPVDTGDED
jgi:hypothetical protein